MSVEIKNTLLEFLDSFREKFNGRIYGYFLKGGVRNDLVDDQISEVYLTVLLKIESGSFLLDQIAFDDFTRYLWGIARNIKKKYFRELAKNRMESLDSDTVLDPVDEREFDSEMQGVLLKFPEALENAIGELPPGQRTVAVLHFLQDHEQKLKRNDISRILGMNPDTVSRNITRAKHRLRELLSTYLQTHEELMGN